MKKSIFISVFMVLAICSAGTSKVDKQDTTTQKIVVDIEEVITDESSLNEIRFANWGDEEWSDNEYIRTLRKYIDSYNNGDFTDEMMEPFADYLKGKFVINYMEPYFYGGAQILFFFIDKPDIIFNTWVYSEVDYVKKVVTNYEVRGGIEINDENSGLSKEEVMETLKANPEIKIW